MIEGYVLAGLFAAILAYTVRCFFADREKARQHETKLTGDLCAKLEKLLPLDEHVRTNLENFKVCLVETLKAQNALVIDLDNERKRVTSKAAATIIGRRFPSP